MYNEYTMQTAAPFSEFVGFTEEEVEGLCERYGLSQDEMKKWYNGYVTDGISVYNPQSVVSVCTRGVFANYWTQTETYEALKDYICLKATPHNYRLSPLPSACLHIFRHIAQISLDGRQPACAQFVQSDEKSDGAIERQ